MLSAAPTLGLWLTHCGGQTGLHLLRTSPSYSVGFACSILDTSQSLQTSSTKKSTSGLTEAPDDGQVLLTGPDVGIQRW